MSRLPLFPLAIIVACGFCAPLQAQNPAGAAPVESSAASRSPVKPGDRNCLRETGSLIRAKPGECLPVVGRSYSSEDIQRTGARNLGDALRLLDPSVTVRGH
jgi:hypothetical protein